MTSSIYTEVEDRIVAGLSEVQLRKLATLVGSLIIFDSDERVISESKSAADRGVQQAAYWRCTRQYLERFVATLES